MRQLVGGIEAGGTKFVCGIAAIDSSELIERTEFPTTDNPTEILSRSATWIMEQAARHGKIDAVGVASFGPVDLDAASNTYGYITSTPKPGWQNTNIVGLVRKHIPSIPIGFDTDVNGAALGEKFFGSAKNLDDFVYITIGTGIGAGGMSGGSLLHGLVHPEVGHLLIPRIDGDYFDGSCPYHGACWEGLCSGPAIEARSGIAASSLAADSPIWQLVTRYSAFALANLIVTLSPRRIIIGGSVRKGGQLGEKGFFDSLRRETLGVLADYVASQALTPDGIQRYITPPLLGDDAGIVGALALASIALNE